MEHEYGIRVIGMGVGQGHGLRVLAHIPIYDGNLRLKIQCKNIITKLRESIFIFLNYRMLLNCRTGRLATPHLRPRNCRPAAAARSIYSKISFLKKYLT